MAYAPATAASGAAPSPCSIRARVWAARRAWNLLIRGVCRRPGHHRRRHAPTVLRGEVALYWTFVGVGRAEPGRAYAPEAVSRCRPPSTCRSWAFRPMDSSRQTMKHSACEYNPATDCGSYSGCDSRIVSPQQAH